MSFCTAINCMDGRVQLPVMNYLLQRFKDEYVDVITEAGPVAILAETIHGPAYESILRRVAISTGKHKSRHIAIAAHHDCAGNPISDEEQIEQVQVAMVNLKGLYPECEVVGLWIDSDWIVHEFLS